LHGLEVYPTMMDTRIGSTLEEFLFCQRITQSVWRGSFARVRGLPNNDGYTNWCGGGVLHGFEVYPTMMDTRIGSTLEEFIFTHTHTHIIFIKIICILWSIMSFPLYIYNGKPPKAESLRVPTPER
jgi:hypothetical protein